MKKKRAQCQKIDSGVLEQAVEKALYKMFKTPIDLSLLVNELGMKQQYDIVFQMMREAQVTMHFKDVPSDKQEMLKALSTLLGYAYIKYEFRPFEMIVGGS